MESLRQALHSGSDKVNTMTLSIQSAKENLAKAKEDVQFWENAVRLLSDPRIENAASTSRAPKKPLPRPYGELKRQVLAALSDWKIGCPCYSANGIVGRMEDAGYVFATKTPSISVNEALVNLQKEGLAAVAMQKNGVRFWAKAPPKAEKPPDAAAE
jgi:hypothetical protein